MSRETEALQQKWLDAARAVSEKVQAPGVLPLAAIRDCSGLEIFQRMLSGELPPPPIAETLDFALVEVEKGRVACFATPSSTRSAPAPPKSAAC